MQVTNAIFYIAILIMSVVIHEISHGFMAEYYGDKTARLAGRLTLNPLKHLDFFGSIILPGVLVLTHSPFLFGWAKPVPYNPYNLRDRKWGSIFVAAAGVIANLSIAILFGLILRFSVFFNISPNFIFIISSIVVVNLGLAIFNLVPIPPLDGSKILFNLLPARFHAHLETFGKYSLFFIVIFIIFFSDYLIPVLGFLFKLISGLSL